MNEKTKPHESVLVGYFCQAVGWLTRDAQEFKVEEGVDQRLAKAINLSHNPLDPAIGDIILQMDATDTLPKEFYVFELKVNWHSGVREEREKFAKKHSDEQLDVPYVDALLSKYPQAKSAHFYGSLALLRREGNSPSCLCLSPYWSTLLAPEKAEPIPILRNLHSIVNGKNNGKGMTFSELTNYVRHLNKYASAGGKASTGSLRFAFAYDNYQLYTFNIEHILELQLIRTLAAEKEAEKQRRNERSGYDYGR